MKLSKTDQEIYDKAYDEAKQKALEKQARRKARKRYKYSTGEKVTNFLLGPPKKQQKTHRKPKSQRNINININTKSAKKRRHKEKTVPLFYQKMP